ncbi:MAG: 4Fe-4S dicluster domain-containing protein [Dehalococcoidales bacterium]
MGKVFLIDIAKCNGCYSCQCACKDEHVENDWMPYNRLQPAYGQFWFKLQEIIRGTTPKIKAAYVPLMCMHCDDAPCMKSCPVDAINKRPDGLVIIDPAKCNGCMLCVEACPYGAIYYNNDLKLAQKCTGCAHLLDRGWPIKEPRCVDACITDMLRFGEEEDFSADIAKSEAYPTLSGEPAPKVRVHYQNLPKRFIAGTVYDPGTEEVVIGATCTLSGADSGTAVTDEFGDFWFEGIAVGEYSVKIEKDGKTLTRDNINTEKDVNLGNLALS